MAAGPQSLLDRDKELVARAEARIDAAIREASGNRVTIDCRLLSISYRQWEEVLRPKYLAAGWKKADWTSDQRDGDFIDLQA